MTPRKQVDGGFILEQEHLQGLCYVLTGPWEPRYRDVMIREDVKYLRLNHTAGARYADLEFVRDLQFLRGVEIYYSAATQDLTPLLELSGLELLGLQCKYRKVDFAAHFPQLRFASFNWRAGAETFFGCRALEFLFVDGYPFEDLTPLAGLGELRRAHVNSRKLARASGVERLHKLTHLTFAFCSSLSDIEAISHCQTLDILEFASCRKIGDITPVGAVRKLQRLSMEDCGEIASIEPLRRLDRLEVLYFAGTRIADGALAPLLELKSLRRVALPKSAKHSHTSDQINAALAGRA